MKALQYTAVGRRPELVEVPTPQAGPGQVRLKITAAGACHSDEWLMSVPEQVLPVSLPLTLGHEGAGVVDQIGPGVRGLTEGDAMLVYGPWGCGTCYTCAQGKENYCERAAELGIRPPGLGAPGAMAEYMIVDDPRHLVPLGDLDPVQNVALTDAGLTPYHAIVPSLPVLTPGTVAVAIGAGGLGHVGIQILKALTACTVVALDVSEDKLAFARSVGADVALLSDESAVAEIRELSGGRGAAAVFDFVAAQPTLDLGSAILAPEGHQVVVGLGDGHVPATMLNRARESQTRAPYWGARWELFEVLDLARAGKIAVDTEVFSLDDAPTAYDRLHEGSLRGRAVVVP